MIILLNLSQSQPLWSSIYKVNETCPRFLLYESSIGGLGDTITRLMMAVSSAYLTGSILFTN